MKFLSINLILCFFFSGNLLANTCTPEVNDKKVLVELINGVGKTIYSELLKVRKKDKYAGVISSEIALSVLKREALLGVGSKNIKVGKTKLELLKGGHVTKVKKRDGTALAIIGGCPISKIKLYTRLGEQKTPFVHVDVIKLASSSKVELPDPTKKYSCDDLKPWMAAVREASGNIDLHQVPKIKLPELVYPALNDDVFLLTFEKPYENLSKQYLGLIYSSLYECRDAISGAHILGENFFQKKSNKLIGFVNTESFDDVVTRRKESAKQRREEKMRELVAEGKANNSGHNLDAITGSWHGTLFQNPIELALWPDPKSKSKKGWIGYLYSPHNNCVMETWLSISGDGASAAIRFLELQRGNHLKDCTKKLIPEKNLSVRASNEFRSNGTFALTDDAALLVLNFRIYSFIGNLPGNSSVIMSRGVMSDKIFAFLLDGREKRFVTPSSFELLSMNTSDRSQAELSDRPSRAKDSEIVQQEAREKEERKRQGWLTYEEITQALLANNFEALSINSTFKDFHNAFLGHYGDHCKSLIKDPDSRLVYNTTAEPDGYGGYNKPEVDGKPRTYYFDKKFTEAFDRYLSRNRVSELWGLIMDGTSESGLNYKEIMDEMVSNTNFLDKFIKNKCKTPEVQKVLENLYAKSSR